MNQYAFETNPDILKKYANIKVCGGDGVRVGIVTAYCYDKAQQDLELFCQKYDLPCSAPAFHTIPGNGKHQNIWYKETATALQYTRAFAPGCEQFVFSAGSDNLSELICAAKKAEEMCDIICLNFGVPEWPGQKEYTTFFNSTKKLFVCASGNNGHVNFPASCRGVLSVGGIYADFSDINSGILNENVAEKSSSGNSFYESAPIWQKSLYGEKIASRTVPDMSFFAYGKKGAEMFFCGKAETVCGTSLAASCVTGICALIHSFSGVFSQRKADFFYDAAQKNPRSFKKISSGKEIFPSGGLGIPNVYEILKSI